MSLLLRFVFLGALLSAVAPCLAQAEGDGIFTLWPLVDYRASEANGYSSLSLLGPLFKQTQAPKASLLSLRPFFSHLQQDGYDYREVLYPLFRQEGAEDRGNFSLLGLFTGDYGEQTEGAENEHMLFPFFFWRDNDRPDDYFAFFPFWGTILDKYGRDSIRFRLFPLYSRTQKKETVTTNILWPFFASVEGPEESGFKAWPLYGASRKQGHYRKLFVLWPLYFNYDLAIGSENPETYRALYPFYVSRQSPVLSSRTWFWPFFSRTQDREKDYDQWFYPWPLWGHATGTYKQGIRVLPFYSKERTGGVEKTWLLWPFFRHERSEIDQLSQEHFRVLFFLYSDLRESSIGGKGYEKRRVSLWPLATYRRLDGVSRLSLFSLLEPFFPENEKIERNWSPLWSIYRHAWDTQGNEATSLLWNLYWKERRGDKLAFELFPLLNARTGPGEGTRIDILKGLLRYSSNAQGRSLRLFFLPWNLPLGSAPGSSEVASR